MSENFTLKTLVGGMLQLLMFPLILFLAAGIVAWPAGWIFLIILYSFFWRHRPPAIPTQS